MVHEQKRKLITISPGRGENPVFYVNVPIEFVRGHELKKGDEPVLLTDGVLLVLSPRATDREVHEWKQLLRKGPREVP